MTVLAPGSPVRRVARRLVNRMRGGAVVLLYHRVGDVKPDPQGLAVSPAHFAEQMEVLRCTCRPISLAQLAACMRSGRIPPRAAVVTFDDGYADNLYRAAPLLTRWGIPATFFVASGAIGQEQPFYWDELATLLVHGEAIGSGPPIEMTLNLGGSTHHLVISECGAFEARQRRALAEWTVSSPASEGTRLGAYRRLCDLMRAATPAERFAAMEAVRCALRCGEPCSTMSIERGSAVRGSECLAPHRALTPNELACLSSLDGLEIGAHTVDHVMMAAQSPTAQLEQVRDCQSQLESIIEKPVSTLSYPYGFRGSYDAASIAAVTEAGMTGACANFPGVIGRCDAQAMEMPRALVGDWDGDTFAQQLRRWFDD